MNVTNKIGVVRAVCFINALNSCMNDKVKNFANKKRQTGFLVYFKQIYISMR